MSSNTLQKITARAKQIRKKKPNMKWSSAIKEASREHRGGKISGTRGTKKKDESRPPKKKFRRQAYRLSGWPDSRTARSPAKKRPGSPAGLDDGSD